MIFILRGDLKSTFDDGELGGHKSQTLQNYLIACVFLV